MNLRYGRRYMLSVIATPIGNLGDITLRAIETLKKCDAIVCEDTRVTGMLLKHLEIPKKELISFHCYSDDGKLTMILKRLKEGAHMALASDAGTPGISDPGFALVSKARAEGIAIEAVPGCSAVIAALSISGLPVHHFRYLGFLPLKKGRKTLIESFADSKETIIFYESVHRIERTLLELVATLEHEPERRIVIAREITKMHEEVITTNVKELSSIAKALTKKGEFVVMVGPM